MTLDDMIAVLQAAKAGKVIQIRDGDDWFDTQPSWNFFECEYRVRPEPRDFWINAYEGELARHGFFYLSQEEARKAAGPSRSVRQVHVREVLK